jgi:hypothetical protein
MNEGGGCESEAEKRDNSWYDSSLEVVEESGIWIWYREIRRT